jgi:high-affinity K+ transport system ATPase subunit B
MLRGLFAATLVVIVLFSTIFARQVAAERNAREKAEAGALRTKQETKQRKAKDF